LAGSASLFDFFSAWRDSEAPADIFKGDAPKDELWALWRKRGWVKEASHYLELGRNVQCKTNLVVPTYTDDIDSIRRMCGWIAKELGPERPLHFSRFHPEHKLTHLTPTPVETLLKAREAARAEGLHYVYIRNVPGLQDAETTFCPGCKQPVIRRDIFAVTSVELTNGKCRHCGAVIAGVWG
jgi:hypothetical protein